ncbi:dorsal interacting protein 2 [Musca autumnalis]|uniref:dorsal interacting protein 2 n=1 Tax=Musca autumnalis TaxID=221902 RepID=UPI003CF4569C
MAVRSCLYKNCQNFTTIGDKNFRIKPNLTVFAFPKDPERRKKWMELGKAPPNLPQNYYFYCSDHFEDRFLNHNSRRTTLVGEAIPRPYQPQPDDNDEDAEEDLFLYNIKDDCMEPVVQHQKDQHILVESTTSQDCDEDIQFLAEELGLDEDNLSSGLITVLNPAGGGGGRSGGTTKNVLNKTYKRKLLNTEPSTIGSSGNKIRIVHNVEKPSTSSSNVKVKNVSSTSIPSYTLANTNDMISLEGQEEFSTLLPGNKIRNAERTIASSKIKIESSTSIPSFTFANANEMITLEKHGESSTSMPSTSNNIRNVHNARKANTNVKIVSSSSIPSFTLSSNSNEMITFERLDGEDTTNTNVDGETEPPNVDIISSGQEINPEKLIDSEQVTCFIFKGEEYVQMSKDYYIKEKLELAKKVEKLTKTIDNIKKLLKET